MGVVLPVLNALLKESGWRYDAIGLATAAAGLGTLIFQAPAGRLTDRFTHRRHLFAAMALLTGACFGALTWVPRTQPWVDSLLFLSGAGQSFFVPLLAALALALAGHRYLNRVMGSNQAWNHAGNIVAALCAIGLVSAFGLTAVFYAVGVCSLPAAASIFVFRERDLDERRATGLTGEEPEQPRRFYPPSRST